MAKIFSGSALFCFFVLLTALMGCPGGSGTVPIYQATINEGRAAIRDVMAESGASSISVAFVEDSRIIWSEATGDKDKEAKQKAETETLYGICSVSKMLSTVSVMILVDQGKVSLDEPLTTYIKNFAMPLDQRYRDITVRMLINHSSGLPGNDMRGAVTTSPFAGYAAEMMDSLKYQRLKHNPGLLAAYNNDGFTMVENLVQAVTGRNYSDFVRENIFEPLGMTKSRYQTQPLPEGSYARSYAGNTRLTMYSFNVHASGGLFSTPEELSRLVVMLINKGVYGDRRILSEKSVAAMAQDQRLGSFNPVGYDENRFGLGWDTVAAPGLAAVGTTVWQKTGDMGGYYGANLAVAPDEKLAVIVLGASNNFNSDSAVKISERILLRALVERGRLAAMPNPLSTADLAVVSVTNEEKNTYQGFYASSGVVYRLIFGADNSLTVDEFQGSWSTAYKNLKLRTDGWYAADGNPITAIKLLTSGGRNYFARRMKRGYGHYSVTLLIGQRLDDKPAISAAWQARKDERWLPVNASGAYFMMKMKGDPGLQFKTIDGVSGYLMGAGILRDMTPPSAARLDGMFLTLPDSGKDMQDAAIETWLGENWLRSGSYLYRPQAGVMPATEGPSTITIGDDGFCQWLRLPASGKFTISGSTYWYLYDADFNELTSGTTNGAPSFSGGGAKYVILAGEAQTAITLNLTTP